MFATTTRKHIEHKNHIFFFEGIVIFVYIFINKYHQKLIKKKHYRRILAHLKHDGVPAHKAGEVTNLLNKDVL